MKRLRPAVRSAIVGLCLALGVLAGALPGEQDPAPGDDPVDAGPFLPGIVSTQAIEDAGTFSPDGATFVFSRREGRWGSAAGSAVLYQVEWTGHEWAQPERLPFSGEHDDGDPFFASDGRHLFFTSTRPVSGEVRDGHDIWVVQRTRSGWGEPRHLGARVNSSGREYSPVVAADGSLYFASTREGGLGQGDIYVARRDGDAYGAPENLGPIINSHRGEWNVFVPPDVGFLIFEASGRTTNRSPSGDLYISYRGPEGWRAPVALSPVNTPASELNARLSPDGEHLYFARSVTEPDGNRHASIFRVRAASVLPHLADPGRDRVVVVARSAHELWIVESGTWRPLHRIPVGRGPHEVAIAPDGRFAYTADYGVYPEPHEAPISGGTITWIEEPSATITEVDLVDPARRRVITVPGCRLNHGILASRDGSRLWTTCEEEGAVQEIDRASGTIVRTWLTAVGSHTLAAAAADSILVVANTQAGSVSLIRRHQGRVDEIVTGRGAEGLALAPDGASVWVSNAQDGTVSVVDLAEGRVLETFPSGGRFPVKLAFAPDGHAVWVVNSASRSLAVLDAHTRRVLRTLEFDTTPLGVLIPPEGNVVLVTFPRHNELAVLDLATGEVLATVPGIVEADGLGWLRGRSPAGPEPAPRPSNLR